MSTLTRSKVIGSVLSLLVNGHNSRAKIKITFRVLEMDTNKSLEVMWSHRVCVVVGNINLSTVVKNTTIIQVRIKG
jgi:hypothetical protein